MSKRKWREIRERSDRVPFCFEPVGPERSGVTPLRRKTQQKRMGLSTQRPRMGNKRAASAASFPPPVGGVSVGRPSRPGRQEGCLTALSLGGECPLVRRWWVIVREQRLSGRFVFRGSSDRSFANRAGAWRCLENGPSSLTRNPAAATVSAMGHFTESAREARAMASYITDTSKNLAEELDAMIVKRLAIEGNGMSLRDIQNAVGISRSSAQRALKLPLISERLIHGGTAWERIKGLWSELTTHSEGLEFEETRDWAILYDATNRIGYAEGNLKATRSKAETLALLRETTESAAMDDLTTSAAGQRNIGFRSEQYLAALAEFLGASNEEIIANTYPFG